MFDFFISLGLFLGIPCCFVKTCIDLYKEYKRKREHREWRRRYDAEAERIDREVAESLRKSDELLAELAKRSHS